MVQVSNRSALLANIRHDFAAGQKAWLQLLLVIVVRSYRSDEGSRSHVVFMEEEFPGGRASHTDVTHASRGRQVANRLNVNLQFLGKLSDQLMPLVLNDIERISALNGKHSAQGAQLYSALVATSAYRDHARIRPGKILCGNGCSGAGTKNCDFYRVQDREREAVTGIAQDDKPLNVRHGEA